MAICVFFRDYAAASRPHIEPGQYGWLWCEPENTLEPWHGTLAGVSEHSPAEIPWYTHGTLPIVLLGISRRSVDTLYVQLPHEKSVADVDKLFADTLLTSPLLNKLDFQTWWANHSVRAGVVSQLEHLPPPQRSRM